MNVVPPPFILPKTWRQTSVVSIYSYTSAEDSGNPASERGKVCYQLRQMSRNTVGASAPPAIVDPIDKEHWSSLAADVKGDAYEGLLQKNAKDVKGGAGQYFTPRALIAAMVEAVAPSPGQSFCDPACGTGGFLLAAHDYIAKHHQLDRAQKKKLKSGTFFGIELVDSVTCLCAMNLLLHGIGGSGVSPLDEKKSRSSPTHRFETCTEHWSSLTTRGRV